MTDLKSLLKPDKGQAATALHLVDRKGHEAWLKAQPARVRQAALAQGFKAEGYQLAILPGERDSWSAALGVANVDELSPWCLAKAAESLPEGTYRVADRGPGPAVLGWLLGQYRFDRYKKEAGGATGRSKADAREIDGEVHLRDAGRLAQGDIVPVLVEDADEHDLYGAPVSTRSGRSFCAPTADL